jgi:hypothetical protein
VSSPPERVGSRFDISTPEGLKEVEANNGYRVFLRPGIRLEDFSKVLVDPFSVSYARPRDMQEGAGAAVRTLDRETEARLLRTLQDAFVDEMKRSRDFELVEEPGPETLRVQGWLYDLIVEEPPRDDPRNFPLCFAEMTVILTVRHSETAQTLGRVADRVHLSCGAERHARFQTADWSDVRDALRPWARFLRRWLSEIRELPAP